MLDCWRYPFTPVDILKVFRSYSAYIRVVISQPPSLFVFILIFPCYLFLLSFLVISYVRKMEGEIESRSASGVSSFTRNSS